MATRNFFDNFSSSQVHAMAQELHNQTDIIDNVDSWTDAFVSYTNKYFLKDEGREIPGTKLSEAEFQERLGQFLYSPRGGMYRERFRFDGSDDVTTGSDDVTMQCGDPSPRMVLSEITFRHRLFSGPSEHIPAMNRVKDIIRR